ncbi:MAG: hypothetical protein P9F75_01755 [Candidatus Contendobacter sp.]|nr:hypothetical protein [Candidatus Contendobacter sp.]
MKNNSSGQKILITGGSGFIGTHLIDSLRFSDLTLLNIDIARPKITEHKDYWRFIDIKSKYPPAEPGALVYEPLKAAKRGR